MATALPVRRIEEDPLAPLARGAWPATIPAVQRVLTEGLTLGQCTVLVGENGAGKSTLVEAIATAHGLNPEGGTHHARHHTQRSESPLANHLRVIRDPGAPRSGVFLRAETMHSHFAYLDESQIAGRHNFQSHGESFIEYVSSRAGIPGLWVLDEAESALSFTGSLALLTQLSELLAAGAQVIVSTHSPVLAALPQATILEVGDWGLRQSSYEELDLVRDWRLFLDAPERFLRHLGTDGDAGDAKHQSPLDSVHSPEAP